MGIVVRQYFHDIAPHTNYEHNTESLPSRTTINGHMKDFQMWREEATVPSLANTMTQRSISHICVGLTRAARRSRYDLEGANEQKSFSKSERNQRSLHPKTTNRCDGEKTVEALRSHLSLVVSLDGDREGLQPPQIRPCSRVLLVYITVRKTNMKILSLFFLSFLQV